MGFDKLKWQRNHRKKTHNQDTRRYEKTPKGFLMRVYRNMKSRVLGIQKTRAHLYVGLSILPKTDFYQWALADPTFQNLFAIWTQKCYVQRLTPSIDRINAELGYELANMRWLTLSENSASIRRVNV